MESRGAADETPIEVWLEKVAEARGTGDHLRAFDLASRGLEEHRSAIALEYQALLALARSGATNRAATRLTALQKQGKLARIADRRLAIDFASLEGRLAKDRAAEATGTARREFLRSSAMAYEAAFRRKTDYFPAINAASMWFLAGNLKRSVAMAREALRLAEKQPNDYWAAATKGEALVLLDDLGGALATLRRAVRLPEATHDKIATTRRQMRLLSREKGLGGALVEALGGPDVVCFLRDRSATAAALDGRRASGAALAAALAPALRAKGAVAYVTLLDPLDIRLAEELRKRKVVLDIVLPAGVEACGAAVAAPWRKRYEQCIRRAHAVSVVTEAGNADEPTSLSLAVEQKMGLTLLRAEALDTEARRLTLEWKRGSLSFASDRLGAGKSGRAATRPRDPPPPVRVKRALVFGDVKGFSTLAERDMARFLEHVIGGFGDALEPFGRAVEYAETAGDGIYLVVSDVANAARCCLALQEKMRPERLRRVGLPTVQGLRVSAHVGPVSRGYDRVTKRDKFFGTEIIRTARIEPVTEVGAIYVTEQFAATLYCEAGGEFRCEYVGIQPMAKGYGACRMYSLRRSRPGE